LIALTGRDHLSPDREPEQTKAGLSCAFVPGQWRRYSPDRLPEFRRKHSPQGS
jgi:hypothetical protein